MQALAQGLHSASTHGIGPPSHASWRQVIPRRHRETSYSVGRRNKHGSPSAAPQRSLPAHPGHAGRCAPRSQPMPSCWRRGPRRRPRDGVFPGQEGQGYTSSISACVRGLTRTAVRRHEVRWPPFKAEVPQALPVSHWQYNSACRTGPPGSIPAGSIRRVLASASSCARSVAAGRGDRFPLPSTGKHSEPPPPGHAVRPSAPAPPRLPLNTDHTGTVTASRLRHPIST